MGWVADVVAWFRDGRHWQGPNGVPQRLLEHVGVSAAALGIACLLAIPLALWLGHVRRGGGLLSGLLGGGSERDVVSDEDARLVRDLEPTTRVTVVPNGVDFERCRPSTTPAEPGSLLFVGRMDYRPNLDAVRWFVRDILPRVRELLPRRTPADRPASTPPAGDQQINQPRKAPQ